MHVFQTLTEFLLVARKASVARPVLQVRGFLLSIGGKLALARFLFIIQNSKDQFTVHSLQFTVRNKKAPTVNCRLSTVDLRCQSSVGRLEPLPMLDRRIPLRYRWAR